MAALPINLYRNYNSEDSTLNTSYKGDSILPSAETLGWEREGYSLSEWNTSRDGTGTSYNVGGYPNPFGDTYYAIWESTEVTPVDYLTTDVELSSIADAIRTKGGTSSPLTFPTGFVSAINNIQPTLTRGTLRPDATLFKEYSQDYYVVADKGVTLPSYTTSSATLVSTDNVEDLDIFDNDYDIVVTYRSLLYPIYNTSSKDAGRVEYYSQVCMTEVLKNIRGWKTLDGQILTLHDDSVWGLNTKATSILAYWFSSSQFTMESSATGTPSGSSIVNGIYESNFSTQLVNWGNSSQKISISYPGVRMKGNQYRFTETFWNAVTDVRVQQKIQVWKSPRGNMNLDGWELQTLLFSVRDDATSSTHTLT